MHSQMWVNGIPLHFIIDNGSQKNLISVEFVERLELLTTPHPQPYNIGWLSQVQGIHITQQFLLPYGIKPFKDEVLCDVDPLEVCDVLLGQPYMWKLHVVYESWPRSVIVTLGGKLYRISETVAPNNVLHGRKISSHIRKLFLFTIASKGEHKITETSTPSAQGVSTHQTQEENKSILLILAHDLGTRNQNHQRIINKYS